MSRAALARLQARYRVLDNGCWEWTSHLNPGGYGSFYLDGRRIGAHRASYQLHIGSIPAGHDIDHECHNRDSTCPGGRGCPHRRCVNPEHLTPATRSQNLTNGQGGGVFKHLTKCKSGHRFDADNTYLDARGWRGCRTCRNDASRRHRARKAAA